MLQTQLNNPLLRIVQKVIQAPDVPLSVFVDTGLYGVIGEVRQRAKQWGKALIVQQSGTLLKEIRTIATGLYAKMYGDDAVHDFIDNIQPVEG